MKRILLMSLLAISTALSAQKPVELELWPDGAPNSNGITTPEQKLENNRITNVSEPTLTIYPAAKPNGLAVVACPGGGYIRLAMNHEGHDMADWFNAQGITYAVLKYRMPNGHHDVPLSDAHQANERTRQRMAYSKSGYHGGLCGRTSGQYGSHPLYSRNASGFSDPVLSRHKHGSVQLP